MIEKPTVKNHVGYRLISVMVDTKEEEAFIINAINKAMEN